MSLTTLCIIVNYKAASLAAKAVESVKESESIGPVDIVVVDNSKDSEEARRLSDLLPPAATLVVNKNNVGFASACNQALRLAQSDLLLLLNPDARLLPGALVTLQEAICRKREFGAVGPQAFLDSGLKHFLPPSCPPIIFYFKEIFGNLRTGGFFVRVLDRIWRAFALKVWMARAPLPVLNLSGGHVLIRTDVINRIGGVLFDPCFFLYFEDTDLFLRMRKAGFKLLHVPQARVVHPFGQSARKNPLHKQYMAKSWERFVEKNLLGWKRRIWNSISGIKCCLGAKASPFLDGGGQEVRKMVITGGLRDQWLFEWGPNPDFIPAIGTFGKGNNIIIPPISDGNLGRGVYYGRLGRSSRITKYYGRVQWKV